MFVALGKSALRRFVRPASRIVNVAALSATVLVTAMAPSVSRAAFQNLPFEEYLVQQERVSIRRLYANISPADGLPGSVIASPSRQDPDYYKHWVRDAGLVMDVVVKMYRDGRGIDKSRAARALDQFVDFSRRNQLTQTLTGLGEPKFYIDGRPYDEPWGRPQNDSPALRAIALIRWSKLLLREGQRSYVESKLYRGRLPADTVIKADLEYVAHHWRQKGFDLWEETSGYHFYTRMVQRAALIEGAELAQMLGDGGGARYYAEQAALVTRALDEHWDARAGRIRQHVARNGGADYKESGLDTATLLGVLHGNFLTGPYSLSDERVLNTMVQVENSFNEIYKINKRGFPATAIGRYPEDVYYGGNPWVLTTAAYAEMNYKLARLIAERPQFRLGRGHVNFLRQNLRSNRGLVAALQPGMTLRRGTPEQTQVVRGLRERGDEFLKRVQLHGHADGGLAEQISRENGFMLSARDLTWSYGSFLTAIWSRP